MVSLLLGGKKVARATVLLLEGEENRVAISGVTVRSVACSGEELRDCEDGGL